MLKQTYSMWITIQKLFVIKQNKNMTIQYRWISWLILLNISSASGLPGFLSGWYLSARRRYFFLISWSVEDFGMSNNSYSEFPDLWKDPLVATE